MLKTTNQTYTFKMKKILLLSLPLLMAGCAGCAGSGVPTGETHASELRAPAYPLVTIDPYTSAWSMTDNLYDGPVRHWTGFFLAG